MPLYLLRDHHLLHTCQQSLAFAQIQAQRFHGQFPAFDCQHLPALFGAVRVYAYHLDSDTHD
jgi:hypothetical protein